MTLFSLRARPGMNLIEVLVAAVVAGIVLLGLGSFITRNTMVANNERDRTVAMQKAVQMLEEMSSYELKGVTDTGPDKYEEQGIRFELTTVPNLAPDSPLSGNPRVKSSYKYVRRILTEPVPGDDYARKVTVQVWYAADNAEPALDGPKPLAAVSGILRSNVANAGPKQQIDIFAISIENLPHVYRRDDDNSYYPSATAARAQFEQAIRNLEATNPWLKFQVHYIKRLSYGRDPLYKPYMNEAMPLHDSGRDPLDWAYFLPGRLRDSTLYYDHQQIGGNHRIDMPSGIATPGAYPLADQYNHAVRAGREFDAARQPIRLNGTLIQEPGELSLRQFLEVLLNAPPESRYRNGIVVNLHGELFPALPLRSFSDPAKDLDDTDANKRERRLVTHPWKMSFDQSEYVRLLVHPFRADGADDPRGSDNGQHVATSIAWTDYSRDGRIILKDLLPDLANDSTHSANGTVNADDVTIHVVQRERANAGNSNTSYKRVLEWPEAASGASGGEAASRQAHSGPHVSWHSSSHHSSTEHGVNPSFSGNDLVINIYDLDYDAHQVTSGSKYGLKSDSADHKLHTMQYFPDPFLPFLDLVNDSERPRNTARIMISFKMKPAAVGKRYQVITQLSKAGGFPLETANDPANSRSWFYVGDHSIDWSATEKRYANVPWTDQVQLVGDPRHNPYYDARKHNLFNPYFTDWTDDKEVYKDIKNKSGDSGTFLYAPSSAYPYDLPTAGSGSDYWDLKFPNSAASYQKVQYNVPAYFRLWREALLRNSMVFVHLAGEPMRFIGLGGEFNLNKKVDGLGDLKISALPYGGGGDANGEADELMSDHVTILESSDDTWYAKPWLGELYESKVFNVWKSFGNLPAGSSTGEYRRRTLDSIQVWDKFAYKDKNENRKRIESHVALAAFLNATQSVGGTPIEVADDDKLGRRSSAGETMTNAIRATMASAQRARYAFKIDNGSTPPAWNTSPYDNRLSLSWLLPGSVTPPGFYTHDKGGGWYAGGSLRISDSASPPNQAFVAINTFRPDSGDSILPIMEAGVGTMLETFMDATRQALGERNIKPLPRVKIKLPRSGAVLSGNSVDLEWYSKWSKADGTNYSPFFADAFTPPPSESLGGPLDMVYFVKFMPTALPVWQTAKLTAPTSSDQVVTVLGAPVNDAAVALIPNETYPAPITATWDTTGLPNGDYVVRIEGYRTTDSTDRAATIPGHHAYHEISVQINH